MATTKKTKETILARKLAIEDERSTPDSRKWWLISGICGALIFLVGAYVAHKHTLTGVDLSLFHAINNWPDGLRTFYLIVIISSNSLWMPVIALVITSLLKLYQLTWQLAAATVASAGAGFIAKHVIAEPRPYKMIQSLHMRTTETDAAYPSGHVLMITTVVLVLWPYLPRGWRWLIAAAIPLMASARVYLGVHTPVDVLGGFGLGLAVVGAMRILPEAWRKMLHFD